jgi:hypothetical protein
MEKQRRAGRQSPQHRSQQVGQAMEQDAGPVAPVFRNTTPLNNPSTKVSGNRTIVPCVSPKSSAVASRAVPSPKRRGEPRCNTGRNNNSSQRATGTPRHTRPSPNRVLTAVACRARRTATPFETATSTATIPSRVLSKASGRAPGTLRLQASWPRTARLPGGAQGTRPPPPGGQNSRNP